MKAFLIRLRCILYPTKQGMELVEVAILIAIAIAIGLIFKTQISTFVNKVFGNLLNADF